MKKYILPEEGQFYKANLHAHCTCSDGNLTPSEIKEYYKKNGYSVYAYTDHDVYIDHRDLTDESFLPLVGFEAGVNEKKAGVDWPALRCYHICFIDTQPDRDVEKKKELALHQSKSYDIADVNDYIRELTNLGCLATYNHPYWSLQDLTDYGSLKNLFAMEIGNYGCSIDGNFGFAPQVYDEMLRSGQKLFCISTDDNHNCHPDGSPYSDSFGGYVQIKAKELSYPAIISALKEGNFYSVNGIDGPAIHEIYIDDGSLVVHSSNAKLIYVINRTRDCHYVRAGNGEYVNETCFELRGNEEYIRVEVVDEYGRTAYSNAYFLEELLK